MEHISDLPPTTAARGREADEGCDALGHEAEELGDVLDEELGQHAEHLGRLVGERQAARTNDIWKSVPNAPCLEDETQRRSPTHLMRVCGWRLSGSTRRTSHAMTRLPKLAHFARYSGSRSCTSYARRCARHCSIFFCRRSRRSRGGCVSSRARPRRGGKRVRAHLVPVEARLGRSFLRRLRACVRASAAVRGAGRRASSLKGGGGGKSETHPAPRRVGLHVCELALHVRHLLTDALVLLDGVQRAEVEVLGAQEEDLGDEVGRERCGAREGVSSVRRSGRVQGGERRDARESFVACE